MRGKVSERVSKLENTRITPAYAGKRDNRYKHNHDPQDHPRLCGEKAVFILRHHDFLGSPPPMRGKGRSFHICRHEPQDHPRLCGEKLPVLVYPLHVQGSLRF